MTVNLACHVSMVSYPHTLLYLQYQLYPLFLPDTSRPGHLTIWTMKTSNFPPSFQYSQSIHTTDSIVVGLKLAISQRGNSNQFHNVMETSKTGGKGFLPFFPAKLFKEFCLLRLITTIHLPHVFRS